MIAGPFAGLEGIVLRSKADRSLLVMSVHLLRRSVAVSVDCAHVEAI
jgi:transcription antitermination factor NusG